MKILYICDSDEDYDLSIDHNVLSYQLGTGKPIGENIESINDSTLLNDFALQFRDQYCDFINSLNKDFLFNNLVIEKKISLFFLTDCSNKRTENFRTYSTICHLMVILKKTGNNDLDKVIFKNCSNAFIESALSIIKVKEHRISKRKNISSSAMFGRQLRFFFRVLYSSFLLKFSKNNLRHDDQKIDSLYFTRFPLHFDNGSEDSIYGKIKHPNSAYLVSIMTDGIHQSFYGKKFLTTIAKLNKINTPFILLDSFLSLSDIFKSFIYYLRFKSLLHFRLVKKDLFFEGIKLNEYIFYELSYSFMRLARQLMYVRPILDIMEITRPKEFHYYLFEFSFGRLFSAFLSSNYPQIKRIGYQHGPISRRKLLFFLSKNEINFESKDLLNCVPTPHSIEVEDEFSLSLYAEAGYENLNLMARVPRLESLFDIKRKESKSRNVLIVCGSNDAFFILNFLRSEILASKDTNYIFKLHPRGNNKSVMTALDNFKPSNFEIANKDLAYYLEFISEVYVTYSSVGVEAMKIGIPVRLIDLPNLIQESPIKDLPENKFLIQ